MILDGRDGHEIRRMPDRGDIQGFACAGPNVAALLLADGSEIWTGADLDSAYSTGAVETRNGDGMVTVDPKLLNSKWVPPVKVTPAKLWPGMSPGPGLELSFEDASVTATFRSADAIALESTGTATWLRQFPLEARQFALAATRDTVATISVQQRGGRLFATLVGLDPATGADRFEVELGEYRRGSFLIATAGLLITDFGARLVALDATTGELRWSVGET